MKLIENKNKTSKAAIIIAFLYLSAVATAFVIMLLTITTTPMAGIFLIFVTLPWTFVLTPLQEMLQLNSIAFNGLFLAAGGIVNSLILYKSILFISGRFKRQA